MSLCEGMRKRHRKHRHAHTMSHRIACVRVLKSGALPGVEKEALHFAFDVVMRGSVAEGARTDHARPARAGHVL